MKSRPFAAVAVLAALTSCGILTGVSDDYTFDRADGAPTTGDGAPAADAATGLDATGPDATASPDAPAAPDAGPDGGDAAAEAAVDAATADAAACPGALAQPSGVGATCYACLLDQCCAELQGCDSDRAKCTDYLTCAAGCNLGAGGDSCRIQCAARSNGPAANNLEACGRTSRCVQERCAK